MAKKKDNGIEKTNVMRVLDQHKIEYTPYCYVDSGVISGIDVAHVMGQEPSIVFKTLVTTGASRTHYVFVVPSCCELDLKKAAKAVGEKSIEMLKAKDLLPLTGYIHGGCSPIGMKKLFTTVVHCSASGYEKIFFSAGKVGYQVELSPDDLKKVIPFEYADIVTK